MAVLTSDHRIEPVDAFGAPGPTTAALTSPPTPEEEQPFLSLDFGRPRSPVARPSPAALS